MAVVVDERGGSIHYHVWPWSYDHRPSHPYNAGTEHVGLLLAEFCVFAFWLARFLWLDVWSFTDNGLTSGSLLASPPSEVLKRTGSRQAQSRHALLTTLVIGGTTKK